MVSKGGFQFKEWHKVEDSKTTTVAPVDGNKVLAVK